MPDFPRIGSRSSEIVPSGNTATHSPLRSASTAAPSAPAASDRAPRHGDLMCGLQQPAQRGLLEQLGLGEEADPAIPPVGDPRQCQRVEVRHVVAREDHRTLLGDVRLALDRPLQPEPQPGPEHGLGSRIDHIHGSVAYAARYGRSRATDFVVREPDRMARQSDARARDGAGIVVPLRSFTHGKARLAAVLDEAGRATLARTMAERVVGAAGARPVVVVSSAPDVIAWALDRKLSVIDDPGSLDAAADEGRTWVCARASRASSSCTPICRSRHRSIRSQTMAARPSPSWSPTTVTTARPSSRCRPPHPSHSRTVPARRPATSTRRVDVGLDVRVVRGRGARLRRRHRGRPARARRASRPSHSRR